MGNFSSNDEFCQADEQYRKLLGHRYSDTEIVIGLVAAVGTQLKTIAKYIEDELSFYKYTVNHINISRDIISNIVDISENITSEVDRINKYMDYGNEIRKTTENNAILALGASSEIFKERVICNTAKENEKIPMKRSAFIISSLKNTDEVNILREIYTDGFYLFGIAEDENRRIKNLNNDGKSNADEVKALIERDRDESQPYGQHTRDSFQLADFFINFDSNHDQIKGDIKRIIGLIFGDPYTTPTFHEFAMFMAFSSALRSADLSRQVGAIIARNNEIIASGANDSPKAKGGLYWPERNDDGEIVDLDKGRDYKRGKDSNKSEQEKIIQNILEKLPPEINKDSVESAIRQSHLTDITEYGRIVHAEMEALMFCARNNISAKGADLYCTTFPCHNCAKHLIAAGIEKVYYVEPYPKSKAYDFYDDSISPDLKDSNEKVVFFPFVGVGPRRFFDLFSMNLSSGASVKRKNKTGIIITKNKEERQARLQMVPFSYLERETYATHLFKQGLGRLKNNQGRCIHENSEDGRGGLFPTS